jgi:DNA helicase II / ATP-dependent DNA helicase PcrA
MFVWSEKDLDKEQGNAIVNENNVLLVACPGSGKTRTLTYKIAYELSLLINSKQYLIAITYTNRAADEIKERIELIGVNTEQLWIGTIHSFCLEWILRPYSLYLPELKNGFRVINSFDSEKLISELCTDFNKKNNLNRRTGIDFWDFNYFAVPKPEIIAVAKNGKDKYANIILSKYYEVLKSNNQIDFEQILFYSYKLLMEKPIIKNILSNIFPYFLIDEYQDTKEIQYYIISSIIKSSNNKTKLFTVGDPNQSIFQNLGGYPIEKSKLEEISGLKIEKLYLTKNYRSSERIISYFDYFKTFENKIDSAGKYKTYDSIISLNTSVVKDDLIDEISKLIIANIKTYNIAPEEICIVAPQWVHIASVTRSLMVKLPDYSFDGPGMAPFSRDIENFWFRLSRIVLTEPAPNLYIQRLRWSNEIIKELINLGVYIGDYNSKKFLKLCNSIKIDEINGLKYLELVFNEIAKKMNFEINNYSMLSEHLKTFFESSKNRIERLKKDGIDFIDKTESFKKVFKQRKGITVSTIHGIKGAEFDTMIGFALLQDYIPHFSELNGLETSKKMLYVIASRARKNLHLIAERERFDFFGNEHIITPHLRSYKYGYSKI